MSLNCLTSQQIICLRRSRFIQKEAFFQDIAGDLKMAVIPKNESAVSQCFLEHSTQRGHYLAYFFEVTANLKKCKDFEKVFVCAA
jgi:hypothetical protein